MNTIRCIKSYFFILLIFLNRSSFKFAIFVTKSLCNRIIFIGLASNAKLKLNATHFGTKDKQTRRVKPFFCRPSDKNEPPPAINDYFEAKREK